MAMLVGYAARRPCCIKALKYLLRKGASPNEAIDFWGTAPLYETVVIQDWRSINVNGTKELLRYGADPNFPELLEGKTPSHWAVEKGGDIEIIKC